MIKRALFLATAGALLSTSLLSAQQQPPASSPLPDGSGKSEFLAKCAGCHAAEGLVGQRRAPQEWKAVVDRMINLGAVLNAREEARVLGYLTTNFGLAPSAAPRTGGASPRPAPLSREPVLSASPRHTLPPLTARLGDYLEMPVTGNFQARDARSQVARINFLVEEPGGRRLLVGDSSGPLYLIDKRSGRVSPFLNFNGAGGADGLFPRFVAEAGYASGLLGLTFDPDYGRNGIFYTIHLEDMTSTAPAAPKAGVVAALEVAKYRQTPGISTPSAPAPLIREAVIVEWTDSNRRNASFEGRAREVLRVQLMNSIHPTNDLSFNPAARRGDPDWRVLYVATGDGGAGEQNDVRRLNPQRLDHFGGKIIRIVPDVNEHRATSTVSENGQYRIPNDNPFVSLPGARPEIWANGMRNPHRITWDGDRLLAFVIGSNGAAPGPRYETVNLVRRGANFGYPLREGPELKPISAVFGAVPEDGTLPLRISESVVLDERTPIQDAALAYKTTVEGNAIANGFVYRGKKWPALHGMVVFGDITSGRIFYARMADLEAATDGDHTTLAPFGEIKTGLPSLAASRMRERTSVNPVTPPERPIPPQSVEPAASAAPPARPRPLRIDLRLATDSAGEIYMMTKSDGIVRRIISVE